MYRLWRDLGYAFGALLAGVIADALGLPTAMWVVAAITFASGAVVALRMTETLQRRRPTASFATDTSCVEPANLDALAHARSVVIVDVRSPEEYSAGHVTGAVNIPLDALDTRAGELPRDALIVTVCGKGGGRSERAAATLRARGCSQVRSLCGGTDAWRRQAVREA